jgi:tetratricopeptide (TPR) repeat protein
MGHMPAAKHAGRPPTEPFEEIMTKAEAALEAGNLNEAERLFGQATVVKPASGAAWYGKGRAFSLQEEWEKALRCFAIATKFDPKHGNSWVGLAAVYLHLGEKDKAREALGKGEELGADHSRIAEIRAALA